MNAQAKDHDDLLNNGTDSSGQRVAGLSEVQEIDDGELDSVSGGSFFGTDGYGNLLDKNGLAIPHSERGTT